MQITTFCFYNKIHLFTKIMVLSMLLHLFKFNNKNTRKRCEICTQFSFLLLTLNIFPTFF